MTASRSPSLTPSPSKSRRKLRPLLAKPGELRLQGAWDPIAEKPVIRMAAGEGVCPDFAAKVLSHLTEPQLTIGHVVARNLELPRQTAFIDELAKRGYDLATFRWSIFLTSARKPLPKRLRLLPQVPGALLARWGRVQYDGPDLCASWALPARRPDMNLFFSLMSSPRYTPEDVSRGLSSWREFQAEFKDKGFDIRTFRFQVRQRAVQEPEGATLG